MRLKGGDPFVFGRGSEEQAYLAAAGVPVEVIPGISSAIAAPAAAGVPVTHRNLSRTFAVVTGHLAEDSEHGPDWSALARIDTLVVLMGLRKVKEVTHNLLAAGRAADHPRHDRRRRHPPPPADSRRHARNAASRGRRGRPAP